jgi:two-component system, OmpR family, sensor kinase
VTLAFAVVMALLFVATGTFIYLRFKTELDQTIDSGLRSRANDVAALVKRSDGKLKTGGRTLVAKTESFAEVLDARGRVSDSSQAVGPKDLLAPDELRRAEAGPILLDRGPTAGLQDHSRLLALPVTAGGKSLVVVVGTSTEARDDSLGDLVQLLLLAGPFALVLSSLAAFGVATAALRPVEAMRSRAAEISADEPDGRLPVPPTRDEIARLGHTLNAMLERLAEALEHERAFVADASHELRTPLAILKTELELALAEGRSPAELRAALASAAEETDRLTQLAEDLLTIAQTEHGELPLRVTRFEVDDLFEGVGRRFSRRAEEAGRRIEIDVPDGLEIEGDRLRLDQAVGNMTDNALRYGAGTVTLRTVAVGGAIELHVLDEGDGFDAEFLGRAFERFSRGSSGSRDGGSGLGLSIVNTIARAHGGGAQAGGDEAGADVWLSIRGRLSSTLNAERRASAAVTSPGSHPASP